MISEEGRNFYSLLKIPLDYSIDKNLLKKNYFSISKQIHPDIKKNDMARSKLLNRAYSVINDDFNRARLFTDPSTKLDSQFLEKCLKLEERIHEGEDLSTELQEKIEKCKTEFNDPVSVGKWAYFKRLLEQICKNETKNIN